MEEKEYYEELEKVIIFLLEKCGEMSLAHYRALTLAFKKAYELGLAHGKTQEFPHEKNDGRQNAVDLSDPVSRYSFPNSKTMSEERLQDCTKEVLTTDEAARYLGISKSYLYKLTMMRKIPHYKPLGKMCYFNRKELEEWLQSNRCATATEINDRANKILMTVGPSNPKLTERRRKR